MQIILTSLPTLAPLISFFRSDTAISYRYRSDGSGGAGGAGGKRRSRHNMLAGPRPNLSGTPRSVGTATIGTARGRHPRGGGLVESDSSQETILPIQGPDRAKSVEEGYILRSVDISVTRGSPGPAEGLRLPMQREPGSPGMPHAL